MTTKTAIQTLGYNLRRLFAARGGNVTVIFALASIPVVGAMGAAVDYSRANSARTAMQAALDSTALMLSKSAPSMTNEQLSTSAYSYFMASFSRPDVTGVTVTPTFSAPAGGNFKIDLAATGKLKTTFASVLGFSEVKIGAKSEVLWGMKRLEVALALDNTGSMAWNNKLTELKKATKNLLSTLKTAAKKPDDVKVAIIPFDTTVNIGTGYKDEPWFDIDSLDCNGWQPGSGCNSTNWKDYWEGCVRDRSEPYNTNDVAPDTNKPKTLFPAYDCGQLVTMMPLTNDWTALNAKVDSMKANGTTNVAIGLVWAYHALTPSAPLGQASAPKEDLDKVIILLTDGQNTEAWNNDSKNKITNSAVIDARTNQTCNNIKQANIKLYTIRVIEGNADLLSKCATNPSMYFDVQQASQLTSVFSAIAQNLANLRLAK